MKRFCILSSECTILEKAFLPSRDLCAAVLMNSCPDGRQCHSIFLIGRTIPADLQIDKTERTIHLSRIL